MIKWWASQQNKLKIGNYSLSGGCTQIASVVRGAQSSERADSSAQNEAVWSRRKSFNANNGSIVRKTAANTSAGDTWCSAEENGVSRRAACGAAGRRAGLAKGWACLLNTFPGGEISNAKFPLVQLMEWPFQKLLHISSLWVLGLKYKFKRAGCRRGVCHFFWYFVSSSLLWSLQQCSSDNL